MKPSSAAVASAPAVWTSVDAFAALLVLLGSLLLVNVALSTEVVRLMPQAGKVLARVTGLAVTYGVELLLLMGLARRHGVAFAKAFRLRPVIRSPRDAGLSTLLVLGLLIGTRLVATAYALVTQMFSWEPSVNWNTNLTQVFGPNLTGFALSVALAVLVGPFVEELVFRGVLLSALGQRWSVTASILISAAVFASYHFSLWVFLPILVLGLALGWLAERTGGLWPSVALHVLYNGVTVAAAFWLAGQ